MRHQKFLRFEVIFDSTELLHLRSHLKQILVKINDQIIGGWIMALSAYCVALLKHKLWHTSFALHLLNFTLYITLWDSHLL